MKSQEKHSKKFLTLITKMKLQCDFSKCIYCLENPADSWEHIIPVSIGGRLQALLLCKNCNGNLGSRLVSKIRTDPSIRIAINNLKFELPELYNSMENNQIYNAKDKNDNYIKMKYNNLKFETKAHKKKDNSLIYDTEKGIKNIEQMLKKDGLSEDKIAEKIQSFKKLEDNKIIQLSKNIKAIKWSIESESIFPNLEGPTLDKKVIALIAYEFLSFLIGNQIFDDKLNFIRKFIKDGEESQILVVKELQSGHYSPYHTIYPKLLETELVINIILFRWSVYEVHFKGFKLPSADFVYIEDLKNKKTLIAESVEKAKQGVYYEF